MTDPAWLVHAGAPATLPGSIEPLLSVALAEGPFVLAIFLLLRRKRSQPVKVQP